MENKRAGFSFKAVGVVGFVLLTFLLIRLLRLPEGTLPSEALPNFLMLLLGVLVLGSSFILLALGRIVELLQEFRSTQTLLSEIRDETERVRIESQYIYEVQKDTLVKLTNINDAALTNAATSVPNNQSDNNAVKSQSQGEVTKSKEEIKPKEETKLKTVKASVGTVSRGASFAASRLSKNIDQGKITPLVSEQDVRPTFKSNGSHGSDIQANTDESTWSSLVAQDDVNDATDAMKQSNELSPNDDFLNVPVADADYDRAAVDGSDDIVDAIPQAKTWKPLADDELISEGLSKKELTHKEANTNSQDLAFAESNITAKVTEVSDSEISDSLDAAVVDLKPDNVKLDNIKSDELQQDEFQQDELEQGELQQGELQQRVSEKEKPVFEDRLSQTERSLENNKISPDNAVRFGSFPATSNALVSDDESEFTLQDISEEDFGEKDFAKSNTDTLGVSRASGVHIEQDFVQSSDANSLEKVFSNVKDTSETSANIYGEEKSFITKSFGTTEDSFENAEDNFDDIREVFDTQAKKLASDVKGMTTTPTTQDRIKDSLKRASDKVARETSDLGKNLN